MKKFETHFSNGRAIVPYSACAYAEGFCEGDGASVEDQIRAWSFLIRTGLCWQLQGWYGRCASGLIESGAIAPDGQINWVYINQKIEQN